LARAASFIAMTELPNAAPPTGFAVADAALEASDFV
jgi:hypothetical protein